MIFGRLVTAMVTPFTRDNKIDWTRVEECIERLIDTGSDGIVVAGTTAESPNLSHDEKIKLFQFTVEKVNKRVKVIAGTGSNNTTESIKLTKEAENLGVDGAMLVVPYYNKPSQEGMYQHFKQLASSTSLSIMIYNIPGRTGINMNVDTMVRLAEDMRNIVAFKEASGDLNQISELAAKVREDIAVYSGDDGLTLPILSVGGVGVVSVASHIVGKELKDLIESYFKGDVNRATELHKILLPVFNGLFVTSNPVPLKYVMSQKGWCDPFVRSPLVEMNEQEKIATDQWAHKIF